MKSYQPHARSLHHTYREVPNSGSRRTSTLLFPRTTKRENDSWEHRYTTSINWRVQRRLRAKNDAVRDHVDFSQLFLRSRTIQLQYLRKAAPKAEVKNESRRKILLESKENWPDEKWLRLRSPCSKCANGRGNLHVVAPVQLRGSKMRHCSNFTVVSISCCHRLARPGFGW